MRLTMAKATAVQGRGSGNASHHHRPALVHAPRTAAGYSSLPHRGSKGEQQGQQKQGKPLSIKGRRIRLAPLDDLSGEGRGAGPFTNWIHTARRARWCHDRSSGTGEWFGPRSPISPPNTLRCAGHTRKPGRAGGSGQFSMQCTGMKHLFGDHVSQRTARSDHTRQPGRAGGSGQILTRVLRGPSS